MQADIAQGAASAAVFSAREMEVRAAIAGVRDPEIDENIAALNFIVGVEVAGDVASVSLRLPTFWCPANFVYLMAGEMRRAVLALPWVRPSNSGWWITSRRTRSTGRSSEGLGFAEAFPAHAEDDLASLRRRFDGKAYLMRQGAVVSILRRRGMSDGSIVEATADALDRMAASDDELAAAWAATGRNGRRWGSRRMRRGGSSSTWTGRRSPPRDLAAHLRRIRGVTTSASANGEMCRMLMAARSGSECGVAHGGGQGVGVAVRG